LIFSILNYSFENEKNVIKFYYLIKKDKMNDYKYIILGGGIVAGNAAKAFVEAGTGSGELCIISNEDTIPYDRPPLSKGFLAGKEMKSEILINSGDFYKDHNIYLFLRTGITDVDFENKILVSEAGEKYKYEKLLIATGSELNRFDLPGAGLDGIHYLRTIDDSMSIREHAQDAKKAVIIGSGFIGMETAAVLDTKKLDVTMVYPEERIWKKFFTGEMSEFFQKYYEERGVKFKPGSEIKEFEGNIKIENVILKNGENIPADIVIAGIGVKPAVGIFKDTDLKIDGGIVVNEFLETNILDVYAAGDVVKYMDILSDKYRHIEHWDNAVSQGEHAAKVMMGERTPFEHIPYFFSDEFDLSYEFWGDTEGFDEVVYRGNIDEGKFSTWWLKDKTLTGAFVMNRPDVERERAQEWIKEKKKMDTEKLKNDEFDLKEIK
jgi:3-phenylpropionate/trans-cinnamate dioxygenase ferredoxin reductase subunit